MKIQKIEGPCEVEADVVGIVGVEAEAMEAGAVDVNKGISKSFWSSTP